MQNEQANPIVDMHGQGPDLMILGSFAVVAFGVLLILVIVRELLPDRKQKRRRLGSDDRGLACDNCPGGRSD